MNPGTTLRGPGDVARDVAGLRFQNPVLLAAGTCGFGLELAGTVALERLGGWVTKSVTREARWGNPAPRVAEAHDAMVNSVGLANPGAEAVRDRILPRLARMVGKPRVLVSVAGHTVDEYLEIVDLLEACPGFHGFELNLSCPNDRRLGGRPFALDREALDAVVGGIRRRTGRPLFVKLAPNDSDLPGTARAAERAGADALTLVNTMPTAAVKGRGPWPHLGAGSGGMSGPALRPTGLEAVRKVRGAVDLPLVGVGGILGPRHVVEYLEAGASVIQMGTATFADPRAPQRVVDMLERKPWIERVRFLPPTSAGRSAAGVGEPPDGPS